MGTDAREVAGVIEALGRLSDDERGASEVAGAALLIGLVGTAALITLILGGAAIDDVRSQTDERQASSILQELDSRFSSISASGDTPQTNFDLGDTNPRDFNLRRNGFVNVTVNQNMSCSTNITMSSLRYENNNDVLVGYEAGGVWERQPGGGSSMVTSPSIAYRSGTIDIHVVNLTGTVDQSNNEALFQVAESRAQSAEASDRVFTGTCGRPDSVTVSVRSDFYLAWADYLESEFGVSATTYDHNDTAQVFLPQSALPERVDDTQNNVINLSDPPAGTVDIDPPPPGATPAINVDKGANNVYSVSVTPLNSGHASIGNITDVEDATNVTRGPIDVTFVLDRSGSMGNQNAGGTATKMEDARSASQDFLGQLNESMDRGAVVSFDDDATYDLTEAGTGRYMTGDFDALNQTISTITAGGNTRVDEGMAYANNVFGLRSNETRQRVMIVLSDGENDGCDNDSDPDDCQPNREGIERAREAAKNGISVYTIGYGPASDIDEAFLQRVAEVGGGEYYHATSSDQLDEVFDDIVQEIARTKAIALAPVSSSYSGSGQTYAPQAAGSMDHIARVNVGGNEFVNINDPTAGSQFTHSFAISDGETVTMEAYDFSCDEWMGTGRTRTHNGDIFNVVRCAEVDQEGTLEPDRIFLDGDQFVNTSGESLLHEDEAWWQGPPGQTAINASLDSHDDVTVDRSTRPGVLELDSNQALVYWELPDGPDSENRLLMLYEIGLSEDEAQTSGVINIEVSSVNID